MPLAENRTDSVIGTSRRARPVNTKAFAAVIAMLIHLVVLFLFYRTNSDLMLTSRANPGGTLRVTLVAPAMKPVAQPPTPHVQPQIRKPVSQKVLTTHHTSPRQVFAPAPTSEVHEMPVVTPPAPPAPPKPAQPLSPSAAPSIPLPTPGQAGRNAHLVCNIPTPAYPPRARRLGHEGTVELVVTIDTTGHVSEAVVQKSSGYEELDDAAQQAMLSGRCDPVIQAGRPIVTTAVQPLSFHLDN